MRKAGRSRRCGANPKGLVLTAWPLMPPSRKDGEKMDAMNPIHHLDGHGREVGNDTLAGVAHLVSLAGDRGYELEEEIERGDARQKREGDAKRPRMLRPVRPAADVADPAREHVQESPV